MVHGGQAHGGWWAAVGAALADAHYVLVPDLSGHGDSGHRHHYSADAWVAELATVAEAGAGRSVVAVGHSLGGKLSVLLAARRPDLVRGLILADAAVRVPSAQAVARTVRRSTTVYESKAAAVQRFRLNPPETIADAETLSVVAEQAVTRVPGGWSWKADPKARKVLADATVYEELARVRCPVGVIYGGRSTVVDRSTVDRVARRLRRPVPSVIIDGAFHHVPLDDPAACRSAVSELASVLEHKGRANVPERSRRTEGLG